MISVAVCSGVEDVEPDRGDDEAEGEAGEAGDQRAGKGREETSGSSSVIHPCARSMSRASRRLNGIAISWGGCDFPAFRVCPAWPHAQDASSRLLAMIALLTVAAI